MLSTILALFASCSTIKSTGKTEAEILYKDSILLKKDGHYIAAIEKLNIIRSKHPYSYYAVHAELLQADIMFDQENYIESAAAYTLFRDFHPKHKKLDYVVFKIAESYFNQLPSTHERDLSVAKQAIAYYVELLQRFPGSQYNKKAQEKINKCNNMLEQKEKYIADFYFKTQSYSAARYRYLQILGNFKKSSLREHAMLRVLESSVLLNDKKKCYEYYLEYSSTAVDEFKSKLADFADICKV